MTLLNCAIQIITHILSLWNLDNSVKKTPSLLEAEERRRWEDRVFFGRRVRSSGCPWPGAAWWTWSSQLCGKKIQASEIRLLSQQLHLGREETEPGSPGVKEILWACGHIYATWLTLMEPEQRDGETTKERPQRSLDCMNVRTCTSAANQAVQRPAVSDLQPQAGVHTTELRTWIQL